jgi:hypothetical protein
MKDELGAHSLVTSHFSCLDAKVELRRRLGSLFGPGQGPGGCCGLSLAEVEVGSRSGSTPSSEWGFGFQGDTARTTGISSRSLTHGREDDSRACEFLAFVLPCCLIVLVPTDRHRQSP